MQLVKEKRSEETEEDKCVEFYYKLGLLSSFSQNFNKTVMFSREQEKTNSKLEGLRTQGSGGARPELSELPENPDMLAGTQGR